ncbi:MAG: efflux transporter periplasmic adaptor subunit [Sphingobacteriales bacterium SCN 48-20]|uniref:efflux RND transporter periplasmic adaptor subunit n=1 Tax=Terrimonas ferruginea TaxID=249 RepID=UPI00086C82E0|nr:efflux RND transporter periplasmic adaptor subunit [Terrimonas ferruginea]MBN8782912.1 efflux RND transporter periplasmic adaptor subunit [Terrimonas ferruginea]ODT91956.1 MAG: efflux transporter periplasmic adaptor subunit [Sphingobacteriales bacterium SCN 48-20]OJW44105.1 MAG: efflux transporter periplasmic adaptor subunit [Sphingobacteriales bacterium 48-107]
MFYKILVTAALAGALLSCSHSKPQVSDNRFSLTDTMMSRIRIDTTRLENVKSELRFSGKITPEDNKLASIFPVVAGYVTRLNVSLGDFVHKGQVLATIRSTDIADFEKQRRDAENALMTARKNLKAEQELADSRLNTERDLTAAQREVENAQAELNRINEVFSIYHIRDGANYNIVAPISGFITDKKINADMQLPAGFSENIFTIAQIDEVFVTANVYETDIARLSVGMPAEIELLSYPGKRFYGKIDKMLNVLDPETKTLKIRIRLPNSGYELKPEMAATVYISRNEPDKKPAIPAEAVVFDKSRNYVMVFHSRDSIETRVVEPLRTTGNLTWIRAGLQEGERVISRNALLVYDALND